MKAAHAALLETLAARFVQNMRRHPGLDWSQVQARLQKNAAALAVLERMEATGGEPDVVMLDLESHSKALLFCDCSAQSPAGRRSLCYDAAALAARKEHKPAGSAQALAAQWGAELLAEAQYHALQKLGEFDTKTSTWLDTPAELRAQGGALFGDRRYGRVFVYHNGAESYYAARGFRVLLRL